MTDSYISMGIYGCLAYLEIDRDSNSASYYEAPYTPWGVPWEGFDPDYPNNPFLYGIDVHGISYATGYTGVSGNYWEKQEHTRWMWVCGTFEEEK